MKKFLFLLMAACSLATVSAQTNMCLVNGKVVRLTPPKSVTVSREYLFPSFDLQAKAYDDTINVDAKELETWVKVDSMTGNSIVVITPQSYLLDGAKLWLQANKGDTTRTIYIKQDAVAVDTLSVTNKNTKRQYVYVNGQWQPIK